MNTGKVYKNLQGNDRNIWQMVREEPEWTAVRVQVGEQAIKDLKQIKESVKVPTFEECEVLAMETDYAVEAIEPEGNEINGADASAFFLEGCQYMYKLFTRVIK